MLHNLWGRPAVCTGPLATNDPSTQHRRANSAATPPGDIMAAHMKTIVVCLTALILAPAAAPAATPALIPQPVSLRIQSGAFRLHSGIAIVVPPGVPEARQAAAYLANALAAPTGWQLKVSESARSSARRNAIVLALSAQSTAPAHPEGYELAVTTRGVRIQ